jgi:hypothetical protein
MAPEPRKANQARICARGDENCPRGEKRQRKTCVAGALLLQENPVENPNEKD